MRTVPDNLLRACRTLFGASPSLAAKFLVELQPEIARAAYRSQAKVHHPDRFENAPAHVRQRQTARFRDIHRAYQEVAEFLAGRPAPTGPSFDPANRRDKQDPAGNGARQRQKCQPQPSTPAAAQIPNIPLEFGMFAYYSGKIPYEEVMRGLAWQRRHRPAIGNLARQWGWLTDQQLSSILDHPGPSRRFGRRAIELNRLLPVQVEMLLAYQRSRQPRLGQYFVQRGLLRQWEADELARRLDMHNAGVRRSL